MIFGNSRGEFEIPRSKGWEEPLCSLFEVCDLDETYGYPNKKSDIYGFENNVFMIFPYYWGDCTCGLDLIDIMIDWIKKKGKIEQAETMNKFLDGQEHKLDCTLKKPNFLYKPNKFIINWYKYPLRDSYMSHNITLKQFQKIINKCKESI